MKRATKAPLNDRLSRFATELRSQASRLPEGAECDDPLSRALQVDAASPLLAWLVVPEQQQGRR